MKKYNCFIIQKAKKRNCIGIFYKGNVKSNLEVTDKCLLLSNVAVIITTIDDDNVFMDLNCGGKVLSTVYEYIADITMEQFIQIYNTIRADKYEVKHDWLEKYKVASVSTPKKIIYTDAKGKSHIFHPPLHGKGDFTRSIKESDIYKTVYRLTWRNVPIEKLLTKI